MENPSLSSIYGKHNTVFLVLYEDGHGTYECLDKTFTTFRQAFLYCLTENYDNWMNGRLHIVESKIDFNTMNTLTAEKEVRRAHYV